MRVSLLFYAGVISASPVLEGEIFLRFCDDIEAKQSEECRKVFTIAEAIETTKAIYMDVVPRAALANTRRVVTLSPVDGVLMDSVLDAVVRGAGDVSEPYERLETLVSQSSVQFVHAVFQRWVERALSNLAQAEGEAAAATLEALKLELSKNKEEVRTLELERIQLTTRFECDSDKLDRLGDRLKPIKKQIERNLDSLVLADFTAVIPEYEKRRDQLDGLVEKLIRASAGDVAVVQREIFALIVAWKQMGLTNSEIAQIGAKAYKRINEAVPFRATMECGVHLVSVQNQLRRRMSEGEILVKKTERALLKLRELRHAKEIAERPAVQPIAQYSLF